MLCWSIGGFEITRSRSANQHRGLHKSFWIFKTSARPHARSRKTECSVLASSYRDLISGREDDLTVRVCLKVGLMLSVRFGLVQEGYFLKDMSTGRFIILFHSDHYACHFGCK